MHYSRSKSNEILDTFVRDKEWVVYNCQRHSTLVHRTYRLLTLVGLSLPYFILLYFNFDFSEYLYFELLIFG